MQLRWLLTFLAWFSSLLIVSRHTLSGPPHSARKKKFEIKSWFGSEFESDKYVDRFLLIALVVDFLKGILAHNGESVLRFDGWSQVFFFDRRNVISSICIRYDNLKKVSQRFDNSMKIFWKFFWNFIWNFFSKIFGNFFLEIFEFFFEIFLFRKTHLHMTG